MRAGPVGLFAAQLARIAGAGTVLVVEPQGRRRALALEIGADVAVKPGEETRDAIHKASSGRGADLVYDCVGNEAAIATAIELCRPGAAIMMLGVASGNVSISPSRLAQQGTHVRHEPGSSQSRILDHRRPDPFGASSNRSSSRRNHRSQHARQGPGRPIWGTGSRQDPR
ncbi:zinc-binding dehydrogenase [Brevibacterium zhoupengii]|uniref:zinc-binding dehydrogenase n=1 Tax=Brevibacterium zhoupengii TaxID=2898795 RepID=UPI001E5064CB|nr:zinc-binding dehydrogenase [Brevibacterium zhoupengii]